MAKKFNAQAYSKARNKEFGLKTTAKKVAAKKRSADNTAKKLKTSTKPTYLTGMLSGGQPRNYSTSKKGIIRSID